MREVDIKILEALGYTPQFSMCNSGLFLHRLWKDGKTYPPPPRFGNGDGMYWLTKELVEVE